MKRTAKETFPVQAKANMKQTFCKCNLQLI